MTQQGIRTRKNGTYELRFRINGKTVSVYGKTQEDCLRKKDQLKLKQHLSQAPSGNNNTIYNACLRLCENRLKAGTVHEEGYRSLVKTARFIGRSVIGGADVEHLNDDMIRLFCASVAEYAEITVKKAVNMLNHLRKD